MSGVAVGQFDFDDGGTYSGGSDGGKAHGYGVCTGPGGQGEYAGAWQGGFELSGVYTWPNGNDYAGQWMQGKRHGLGMERRGHWIYRGEWTQGFMGRYGVRQSTVSEAKYEGTWTSGLHDGYGLETYSDGGTYQGQWMKGMRHGYGVRKSAVHSKAALCRSTKVRRSSLTSIRSEADSPEHSAPQEHSHHLGVSHGSSQHPSEQPSTRIGFFLKGKFPEKSPERRSSFLSNKGGGFVNNLKRQRNQGDASANALNKNTKADEDEELLVETYTGEWKSDKRSGFGVCERTDGLRYEGEWLDNFKNGYGITMFADGTKEEGKYKNNVLLEPSKKMLLLSAKKIRERIDAAVSSALKASQIASQKSDIANSRMESARSKAELAAEAVEKARRDAEKAKQQAKEVLRSEANALSPSGSTKITKRLSIPRHNMVDIQPDIVQLKQQQLESPSSSVPNHVRSSSIRQQSVRTSDQLDGDARQPSLRRSDQHSSSLRAPNHRQLTSVMETALEDVTDEKQGRWSENFPEGHINQMSTRKPNEPDYSQMNSINASDQTSFRNQRANLRQSLEQLAANVPGQTSQHTPISNGQSQLLQRNTSRDLSEEDHMAEIENIFSYLAEEEQDMLEQGSRAEASQNSPEMSQHVTGLLSRPSLRYRRDVRCPNLLIANQVSDAQKKPATVKRRLTLPSIVKYGTTGPVVGRGTGVFVASNDKENVHETKPVETIVIEEGVRKRLEEEKEYRPPPLPPDIDPVEEVLEPPKELRRRYRLESVKLTKRSDLGSLPNVSMFRQMEGRALPRQEAEMLCLKKREELNQLREIEEQMRRRAVVLKIGDFKDWCRRHALTLFLIAVNVMLAVAFKKLLSS